MAKKKIDLGKVGPAGDTVSVTGTVEDDTLGAGDATNFSLTIFREQDPAVTDLTVWIILLGPPTVHLYPPYSTRGNARIVKLSPRQSRKIPFLITNEPEGAEIASYSILCAVQWDEHEPCVLPLFTVRWAPGSITKKLSA